MFRFVGFIIIRFIIISIYYNIFIIVSRKNEEKDIYEARNINFIRVSVKTVNY